MTRLCTVSTFSSVVASLPSLGHPDRSSSVIFPPPSKFSSPFLHCALRRRLLPMGFHEVFIKFLGRYSLLTEVHVLYDCSNHLSTFCQLTHPSPLYSDFLLQSKASKSCSLYQRPSIRLNYRLIWILYQVIESKYIVPRTFWSYLVH